MLERFRQFEGADQAAFMGAPEPSTLGRLMDALRRLFG